MRRLQEKISIITGAGRGLGAATAIRFAQEGARVVVNDVNEENAKRTAEVIQSAGGHALVDVGDVSKTGHAKALVDKVKAQWGRIDILVNNAGITRDALLVKTTEAQWDEVMQVNLKGPFLLGQACAQVMGEQKSGRIINVASISWLGNIGQSNYSASKAGVVGMTKTWALELAKMGVTCNAIAPGFFDTQMTQTIPDPIKEKFVQKIPLKRMGKPEEIAALMAFIASDEAAYLTGQIIHLDGGLTTGIN